MENSNHNIVIRFDGRVYTEEEVYKSYNSNLIEILDFFVSKGYHDRLIEIAYDE